MALLLAYRQHSASAASATLVVAAVERDSVGCMPASGDRLPAAFDLLPFKRTIHLTLGTVFHEASDVLGCAIGSLRTLPFNLVVTVGPNVDPARFGPQPAHVLIEPYVSHALLLRHCCLVVSQGGAGIMFGALKHGLPQLVIPQGGDQFMNAEACEKAGAALSLAPAEVSAEAIPAAVERLLDDPSFTAAARSVQAEIQAMPDVDTTLATVTGTAAGCAPMTTNIKKTRGYDVPFVRLEM